MQLWTIFIDLMEGENHGYDNHVRTLISATVLKMSISQVETMGLV